MVTQDPRKGKTVIKGKRDTAPKVSISYSLNDVFNIFYGAKKAEGMRDRTLKGYTVHWRYFRSWLDDEFPSVQEVRDVTAATIRDYVNYMSNKTKYAGVNKREMDGGLSPYTIALRLRDLRTMFNFLSREGLITVNPVNNIKPPRMDIEKRSTLTDEHIGLLIDAPDTSTFAGLRDRCLMRLLADSGLRIQEALRLTTEHVDMKSRCLHLPAWMNKNRKPRLVPISPEVVRDLIELINENKRYFDSDGIYLSNYGELLKADHFRKRLKVHAKKAGIKGVKVAPHEFRHHFCRAYLLGGGDLFSLQRIVAHENIETTRGYVEMGDDDIREQHARFSPLARLGKTRVGKVDRDGRRI